MTKLPEDLTHLNLTNEEFEKLSENDHKRLAAELPCNDAMCYSEANHETEADLSKLPCVIDGLLIY